MMSIFAKRKKVSSEDKFADLIRRFFIFIDVTLIGTRFPKTKQPNQLNGNLVNDEIDDEIKKYLVEDAGNMFTLAKETTDNIMDSFKEIIDILLHL